MAILEEFIYTFHQVHLVPLFTTRGVVEPPENDLIISETSIRSFRYLENQNPSIIDWVIDSWSGRKIRDGRTEEEEEEEDSLRYYVGFLATREAVALLANDVIMPGRLDTLNIKIRLQTAEIIF